MPVSSAQFAQTPWKYVNGLTISNNATTPNTKLDVASGSILDSTGVYQLSLPAAVTLNAASTGLNGIDTGTFAASKVYAVYLVADPVTQQTSGIMISLSLTGPLMPYGYSAYALIGYAVTDASVHFLPGYWKGVNSDRRLFMFDAPQATAVTAGAATTATGVSLAALVPAQPNVPTWLAIDATPSAASRVLSLTGGNQTGITAKITSQVTSVHVTANVYVMSQLVAGVPTVNYLWSAGGGDAVAINVAGFEYFL